MGLHETAALVRRLIALAILGTAALIILVFSFNALRDLYWKFFPRPEPTPTVGFGKLPLLKLPSLVIKGMPTYTLDTATGQLPDFSDRAEVVAMRAIQPSPLGEQRAKDLAHRLDFAGEGVLSAGKRSLTFRDETDKRTLTIEVTSQNFTLTTDLSHIQRTIPKGRALSTAEAVKEAQEFLSQNGLLKGGYEAGRQTTQIHRVVEGKVVNALSVSEGQFTRVDFFRNLTGVSASSYSILPSNPKIGLIQVWITAGSGPEINNILYASYTVWEMNKEQVGTYPLRSIASAWEEVKQGKGIAELLLKEGSPLDPHTPLTIRTVSIRRVGLAYFDDSSWQNYLQPIYVFSGSAKTTDGKEAEFTAYVPAVSTEWIQE